LGGKTLGHGTAFVDTESFLENYPIVYQAFWLGNIVKYAVRCEHKGSKQSDLIKVIWYAVKELTNDSKEADAAIARVANYLQIDIGQPIDRTES